MGSPFFLVENFFSAVQFSAHTVTAEEEPASFEAFRVADGRRSNLDYATASTANSDWWIRVRCDRLRAANAIALDRGHNLAGKTVALHASGDDFVTYETVFSITFPSAAVSAPLDGTNGARTEEGAWLRKFDTRAAYDWRLYITAAASFAPKVVGLWLGMGWVPPDIGLPVAFGSHDLVGPTRESDLGWMARGQSLQQRSGMLRFRLNDLYDYELARYHIEGHYGAGRPMWFVPDDDQAQEAFQVIRPRGPLGFARNPSRFYPEAEVVYQEHEPAVV